MQTHSIKALVVVIAVLTLVACNNQPKQPQPQTSVDISQYIDPSLRPEDQNDYMAALETLGPDALGNLTFINTEGQQYGSSARARIQGQFLKPVSGNLFKARSGEVYAFPESDNLTPVQLATRAVNPCGDTTTTTGAKSGEFRRVSHKTGTSAAPVNWMRATVHLPVGISSPGINPEAGGFLDSQKINNQDIIFVNGPFVYAGGWGATGKAVDAGFQLSTGALDINGRVTANHNGGWRMFLKIDGVTFLDLAVTSQLSDDSIYAFKGGQDIIFTFLNLNDTIVAVGKGKTQNGTQQTRVLAAKIGASSGWTQNGQGSIYKMMVSIAQGRVNTTNANRTIQIFNAKGFIQNAQWLNPKSGYVANPKMPAFQTGKIWYFSATDDTVAPTTANQKNYNTVATCEFPNDSTAPQQIIGPNPGDILPTFDKFPDVVKSVAVPGGDCTNIDLRQPPFLYVVTDLAKIGTGITANVPCGAANTQGGHSLSDWGKWLQLSVQAGTPITKKLYLQNKGSLNAIVNYKIYPIGQHADPLDATPAFTPRRVRNPVTPIAQTKPANSPWVSALYTPKTGRLLNPSNPVAQTNETQLILPLEGQCPTLGGFYNDNIDIVYNTGGVDDQDTPTDLADDKPELEMLTVPIRLECKIVVGLGSYGDHYQALAAKSDGSLWAWGTVGYPVLPPNIVINPTQIATGVQAIDMNNGYSFVTNLGEAWTVRSAFSLQETPVQGLQCWTAIPFSWNISKESTFNDVVQFSDFFVTHKDGTVDLISSSNFDSGCRIQTTYEKIPTISDAKKFSLSLSFLKKDGTIWNTNRNNIGGIWSSATKVIELNNIVDFEDGATNCLAPSSGETVSLYSIALRSDGTVWKYQNFNQLNQILSINLSLNNAKIILSMPFYVSRTMKMMDRQNANFKSMDNMYALQNISTIAEPIAGLEGVVKISSGGSHFLALKSDGTVWSWGCNIAGQLGNGTISDLNLIPTKVNLPRNAKWIAATYLSSLVVLDDGSVRTWGVNQLTSDLQYDLLPTLLPNLHF